MAEFETETYVRDVHDELYGPTRLITHPNRAKPTGEAEAQSQPAPASTPDPAPQADAVEEPPLGGVGSGRDAWVQYAERLGLTVEDDMTRDDIVVLTRQHTGG